LSVLLERKEKEKSSSKKALDFKEWYNSIRDIPEKLYWGVGRHVFR
jgi:hypothetical protein